MEKTFKAVIECAVVCCGVLLIIHRRVIAAAVTGSEMPKMPEWHKRLLCCGPKGE